MTLAEILVKDLRPEHRDREWVDAPGRHWLWREDTWTVHAWPKGYSGWMNPADRQWLPIAEVEFWKLMPCPGGDYWGLVEDPAREMGPFMEALHHKVLHS